MDLWTLFRRIRRTKKPRGAHTEKKPPDVEIYSGMRVEVTTPDGQLLFVAKLMSARGTTAELHQYSEAAVSQKEEQLHVKIRGYHDHEKKAVSMEGVIQPKPRHIWQVEDLTVTRIANDRAFSRLTTNLDATATSFEGSGAGEKYCRLLNISVGGVCILTEHIYRENDRFLLKVKLLEDRDISAMLCQVLRVTPWGDSQFECGCRFLEVSEADQEKIAQCIFSAQQWTN